MAQEDNTAGRHGPAILVSIARELDKLVSGLSEDRREGGRRAKTLADGKKDNPLDTEAKRAALRRELAASALERVISFLLSPAVCEARPDVVRLGLHVHLQDNYLALREHVAGAPADLFRLPPGRRVASLRDAQFRGKVAAIAELLVMHADPREEPARRQAEARAGELVAAELRKVGYGTPRGSKSENRVAAATITGSTVRAWLEAARYPTDKTKTLDESFRKQLELARHRKAQGESYGATAARMMDLLAQDMPGAPLHVLPLRRDPPPGKRNLP